MVGRSWRIVVPLACCLLLALPAAADEPVSAEDAPRTARDDSLAAAWADGVTGQRSWLGRLLHRYFGHAPQTGDALDGRAEQIVDRYAEHAGKRIAVVIVQSVLRFEEVPDTTASSTRAWLNSLAGRFRSYTRDEVVRQYLLFEREDRIDPYALADSERLLRGLDYVNDARILVMPVGGSGGGVAVVVEYRDRWPFGATGRIKDEDRFRAGLFSSNVAGYGVRFENEIVLNRARDPHWGYAGRLAKENLGGSFVDAEADFEDSWRQLRRAARLDRRNRHPAINYVGGLGWQVVKVRDNDGQPLKFEEFDAWTGRVFPLATDRGFRSGARRTLTPAVSYGRRLHRDRPVVKADSNQAWHDRRTSLVGLTYQRLSDVKTSFLFRMGESEDVPAGMTIKLAAGYEEGEFLGRTPAALHTKGVLVRARGDVLTGDFNLGGYWRNGRFEDGVLDLDLTYITRLLGAGRYQHRLYGTLAYTLGMERVSPNGLVLDNRAGVRGLEGSGIRGDQRLVAGLESRLFTPWRLFGFRVMTFLYGDAGAVGDEEDALVTSKFYSSLGGGMRFSNPDLVLPTFELRLGVIQTLDSRSFAFAFDLGNAAATRIGVPGVKPGLVLYE